MYIHKDMYVSIYMVMVEYRSLKSEFIILVFSYIEWQICIHPFTYWLKGSMIFTLTPSN